MGRLIFSNADAIPKTAIIEASLDSIPTIMSRYGAYHAGDRYTVVVDGRNVPVGVNGEPKYWPPVPS